MADAAAQHACPLLESVQAAVRAPHSAWSGERGAVVTEWDGCRGTCALAGRGFTALRCVLTSRACDSLIDEGVVSLEGVRVRMRGTLHVVSGGTVDVRSDDEEAEGALVASPLLILLVTDVRPAPDAPSLLDSAVLPSTGQRRYLSLADVMHAEDDDADVTCTRAAQLTIRSLPWEYMHRLPQFESVHFSVSTGQDLASLAAAAILSAQHEVGA